MDLSDVRDGPIAVYTAHADLDRVPQLAADDRLAQRRGWRDHRDEAVSIRHCELDTRTDRRQEDGATGRAILDLDDVAQPDPRARLPRPDALDARELLACRQRPAALGPGEVRELQRHARIIAFLAG
jgi:hypothetical protein